MYIVILGNIVDGLVFIGPFEDNMDAIEFGEDCGADKWLVHKLTNQLDMATEAAGALTVAYKETMLERFIARGPLGLPR